MDHVGETILDDLKDALEQMRVGGGYNYDWGDVLRQIPKGSPASYPVCYIRPGAETQEPLAYPLYTRHWEITIVGVHKVRDNRRDEPNTAVQRLRADIEAAVMQDCTRGGVAVDTLIVSTTPRLEFDAYVGVEVKIIVHYRTRLAEPTVSA